ncbi:Long chain acyl-CoA synthetase 2 [Glycine max]|nr:Long chain acyl-CoA synthetase 2 [Glycine max]
MILNLYVIILKQENTFWMSSTTLVRNTKNIQLRGFELLKAIHLEPNPFDIERDLITPTFKLKRPQFLKYYKVCFLWIILINYTRKQREQWCKPCSKWPCCVQQF